MLLRVKLHNEYIVDARMWVGVGAQGFAPLRCAMIWRSDTPIRLPTALISPLPRKLLQQIINEFKHTEHKCSNIFKLCL